MKKWLVICGVCAALLAAAAVYVFRSVRLDTSGAVSAQLHIVHNYGWELKYDGDLIPHIYSYSYTLESGSEEFDALIDLLDGVQLRRALRDTAPDYEPFEVDVTLYDAGGERVCEADMCWGRIRMDGVSYAVGSGSAEEVNAIIDAVRELVE